MTRNKKIQIKLLLLFVSFLLFNISHAEKKHDEIQIYIDNPEITKVIFDITESMSLDMDNSFAISILKSNKILSNISGGKKVNLVITSNYNLISQLKILGFVNLSFVYEIFYDKLVYIINGDKTQSIFLKSSKADKDIFNKNQNIINFAIIKNAKTCENISQQVSDYSKKFKNVIIRHSIASKCKINFDLSLEEKYKKYYIIIIASDSFKLTKKIADKIKDSTSIKKKIESNGFFGY
jgi:hypothetical protein